MQQGGQHGRGPRGSVNPFTVFSEVLVCVILFLALAMGLLIRESEQLRGEGGIPEDGLTPIQREALRKIAAMQDTLRADLQRHGLSVAEGFDSLVVRFRSDALFPTGQASLVSTAAVDKFCDAVVPVIARARQELAKLQGTEQEAAVGRIIEIQVQGHTDRQGWDHHSAFDRENWRLSLDRAAAVRDRLIQRGVPPWLLSAAGYAWYRPVQGYAGPEAKYDNVAENRRVDVRIIFQRADEQGKPVLEVTSIRPLNHSNRQE